MKDLISNRGSSRKVPRGEIKRLLEELGDKEGTVRKKAREAIVSIGTPAVEYLSKLAVHPKSIFRWEAQKALGEIADPDSGAVFILSLQDEESGIRWLAAEGLIALGENGAIAALEALFENADSSFIRHGVHHVLRKFYDITHEETIAEVLSALDSTDNLFNATIAADKALKQLKKA